MMLCLMKKFYCVSIYITTVCTSNVDESISDVYTVCYVFERKTGNVIKFAQFEEENILTKTRNDAEISDKSNNKSIIMSEHNINAINFGDESDHDLISTKILEDIRDGSQTHANVNRIEARYKIRDCIRQI